MSEDEAQEARTLKLRAELSGMAIRPEHLDEVLRGWRLIEPHLARVTAISLGPEAEPAPFFRP